MQTQVKIMDSNKVIVTIGTKRKVTLRGWAAQQFLQIDSSASQYAGQSGRNAAIMFAVDCGTIGTD